MFLFLWLVVPWDKILRSDRVQIPDTSRAFYLWGIESSYQSRKSSSMVRAAPGMEKSTGSNPVSLTNTSRPFFQFLRHMEFLLILTKEQVVGSSPTCGWLVQSW